MSAKTKAISYEIVDNGITQEARCRKCGTVFYQSPTVLAVDFNPKDKWFKKAAVDFILDIGAHACFKWQRQKAKR